MRETGGSIGRAVIFAAVLGASLGYHAGAVTISEYAVPNANSKPNAITLGSDGALWLTGGPNTAPQGSIWRMSTAGAFTQYPLPPPPPAPLTPGFITAGPDGALWFTAVNGGGPEQVAQITTSGIITAKYSDFGDAGLGGLTTGPDGALWLADPSFPNHFPRITRIPVDGSAVTNYGLTFDPTHEPYPVAIAAGSDGALWFTGRFWFSGYHFIGRITTAGAITAYPLPADSGAEGITAGPDGALWFTEGSAVSGSAGGGNKIGRVTTAGVITEYPIPTPNAGAFFITAGPDGALWFTEQSANQIGRISTAGVITEYPVPTANSGLGGITTGPDGVLWFTEGNASKIGRLVPDAPRSLRVTSTHSGNFVMGQPNGAFTLSVQNIGAAATSGMVSVTDTLPAGLTAAAINGPGWTCTLATVTCSRSDPLAAGGAYPPITVNVSVVSNATSPVTNQVSTSVGGSETATAIDPTTIVPAFSDIPASDLSFIPFIDLLQQSGITKGCQASPPMYCSTDPIPESQMAVFVIRSVIGSDTFAYTPTPYFTDVPANNLYFPWIQKMQDLGIALPCSQTQYCPDSAVTRGIMSVLIVRSRFGVSIPANYPSTPYFTDVPATHPYFPWIQKMKQLGITSGCTPTAYCPNDPVTRGQMAVFIMRGEFNQGLQDPNTPVLVWANPSSASPGQTVTVTIVGQNTNFSAGVTQVTAGAGITVGNVTVSNGTTLTAQLAVAAGAALGPRSITANTGSEEATLPNGFVVR